MMFVLERLLVHLMYGSQSETVSASLLEYVQSRHDFDHVRGISFSSLIERDFFLSWAYLSGILYVPL
ncbi:hypothetical protein Pan241w_35860 [Gimesia alba]|uniref:Uncharacterized protein n=1 Tax=Gimesia alba TaxID=2527973 RepID=A0A517RHY7_9PLAN|nr:hypothetical protein Pan241w_35860 [Gimesia alba]